MVIFSSVLPVFLLWAQGACAGRLRTSSSTTGGQDVRRPATDARSYAYQVLESGLQVLAVNDPDAEKAAYAMGVGAGSLEDPEEFQGLAHFCEHMLFLGSAKYPDPSLFSSQQALHGGHSNAFTAADATVYFNEIGEDGFEESLDIFAQFFVAPSFAPEMVTKEVHAVDSEHRKNMPNPTRRLWHLLRSKASPSNPTHKFATGTVLTLKDQPEASNRSLAAALAAYHQENYCAERMRLVLVSNRTTENLLDLASEHFATVPPASRGSACASRPTYFDKPAFGGELGNIGRRLTAGTQGEPELWLFFPVEALAEHYKALPAAYLEYALSHYGPGSLKAILLREDLCQSYTYQTATDPAGSSVIVAFKLTERGARESEKVLAMFFAYMRSVREQGVSMEMLASFQDMRQVAFDYSEQQPSLIESAMKAAYALLKYDPEDVLTGGVLIDELDVELADLVLAAMTPGNTNVVLLDPAFDEDAASHREPHYDFGYDDDALHEHYDMSLFEHSSGSAEFAPVPELQFIPRKLELIDDGIDGAGVPQLLVNSDRTEVWWLGPGDVRLPKAIAKLKLSFTPEFAQGPEGAALAMLHARLVTRALEEPSDALQNCGLFYKVEGSREGLSLTVGGFDEHLEDILELVLPAVRSVMTTEKEFERVRRQMALDLGDVTSLKLYEHAFQALAAATTVGSYTRAELFQTFGDASSSVNFAGWRRFEEGFLAKARLSVLFVGNMGRVRSLSIAGTAESLFWPEKPRGPAGAARHVQVPVPSSAVELLALNPVVGDPESATIVAYQFGVPTIADRVHLSLLSSFMSPLIYEELRTARQLGYVVIGRAVARGPIIELQVLVQGSTEPADVVEDLIEAAVQNITSTLAAMSPEDLHTRRGALRNTLAAKDKTLAQLANRHWPQIWDETYCFQQRALELAYLDGGSPASSEALLSTWRRAVAPSEGRKRIVVKFYGAVLHGGSEPIINASAFPARSPSLTLYERLPSACEPAPSLLSSPSARGTGPILAAPRHVTLL